MDVLKTFANVKMVFIVTTVIATAISLLCVKLAFVFAEEERSFVYVAGSQNTLLLALANDVQTNRKAEAEMQVRRFHELFFILSPDADFMKRQMEKALYVSDNTVKNQYGLLSEKGYFNSMIANGVSSEFQCDSVCLSEGNDCEFYATMYGKTSLVYGDKVIFRNLKTSCGLVSCDRDVCNPNGFKIVNWKIEDDSLLGIVKR